jgi:hypothetical protein
MIGVQESLLRIKVHRYFESKQPMLLKRTQNGRPERKASLLIGMLN